MNIYSLLADLVVILHAAYVGFVVLGLLAVLVGYLRGWRWICNFWFRIIHLTMILAVVAEAWLNIVCPLTTWEQFLRQKSGGGGYQGDFIGRWMHELLFVDLSPEILTLIYTIFGLTVLGSFFIVPPVWPGKKAPPTGEKTPK